MQIRVFILEVYKNVLLTNVGSPFPSHFHLPQIHGCCFCRSWSFTMLLIEYFKNIGGTMFSDSSSMSSKVFFLGMFECQSFLGLKCGRDFCSNGNTWKLEIKLSRKHQQNKLKNNKRLWKKSWSSRSPRACSLDQSTSAPDKVPLQMPLTLVAVKHLH